MKILVHSMDGTGHINACLGMAQALKSRNHDVFFVINEELEGACKRFGFREILLRKTAEKKKDSKKDANNNEPEVDQDDKQNPAKKFGKQLLDSGLLSGLSSIEKLACLSPEQKNDDSNYVKTLYELLVDFTPQFIKLLDDEKPDCIVFDHFLLPPFLARSSIPWAFLFSGNPLPLLRDSKLPPPNSGYALAKKSDEDWEEFNVQLGRHFYRSFYDYQVKLNNDFDYKPDNLPPPHHFGIQSPFLNIYQYPEELDYYKEDQMPPNFVRVDAFVREEVQQFSIPEKLLQNKLPESRLIYLSLGSMGSYDIDLMQKIVGFLGKTCHKIIVSKGPRGDEYELPDNCWGANFLPQPNILPLVDLVITHGGNNTVTESFALGKPMIVMPLFADQYDNAQRLDELGFGVRLETYAFTEQQLLEAIERLLTDQNLANKMKQIAAKIKAANRKENACEMIENLVNKKV